MTLWKKIVALFAKNDKIATKSGGMKNLTLRSKMFPDRCEGELYHEDLLLLRILELPYKDNAENESSIPSGSYLFVCHDGREWKDVWICTNPPGMRDGILIHSANWTWQIKGCLATGEKFGLVMNKAGNMEYGILSSQRALEKLKTYIGRDKEGKLLPFLMNIDRIQA